MSHAETILKASQITKLPNSSTCGKTHLQIIDRRHLFRVNVSRNWQTCSACTRNRRPRPCNWHATSKQRPTWGYIRCFFKKLEAIVGDLTAADERGHDVTHVSQYLSISNLIKQVKARVPKETNIWFMPLHHQTCTRKHPNTILGMPNWSTQFKEGTYELFTRMHAGVPHYTKSAKWCARRACVLTCLACLRVCMLAYLACLRAYVLVCLRAFVLCVFACLCACIRVLCLHASYDACLAYLPLTFSRFCLIISFVRINQGFAIKRKLLIHVNLS